MATRFGLEDVEGESDVACFLLSLCLSGQHHSCFCHWLFTSNRTKQNKIMKLFENYISDLEIYGFTVK